MGCGDIGRAAILIDRQQHEFEIGLRLDGPDKRRVGGNIGQICKAKTLPIREQFGIAFVGQNTLCNQDVLQTGIGAVQRCPRMQKLRRGQDVAIHQILTKRPVRALSGQAV